MNDSQHRYTNRGSRDGLRHDGAGEAERGITDNPLALRWARFYRDASELEAEAERKR